MSLLCFTKAFSVVFLGSPRSEYHDTPKDISLSMKIAMCVQGFLVIAIGLAPAYVFKIISLVAAEFAGDSVPADVPASTYTLNKLTFGLLVFIGISGVVFIIRSILLRGKVSLYKTWDCGYQAGNTRMQYTASSFAGPFVSLIRPLLRFKKYLTPPSGLFPKEADYESHIEDKFEYFIIDPVIRFIERFLNLFTWIQSGGTQQYIIYGLVFLIALSLLIMGV